MISIPSTVYPRRMLFHSCELRHWTSLLNYHIYSINFICFQPLSAEFKSPTYCKRYGLSACIIKFRLLISCSRRVALQYIFVLTSHAFAPSITLRLPHPSCLFPRLPQSLKKMFGIPIRKLYISINHNCNNIAVWLQICWGSWKSLSPPQVQSGRNLAGQAGNSET